ncbi:MAG TPA: FAD/NAD(P)-binding protein [Thermoanaerobaculia bacterium]|nr:FAD/NAD(P)-binding protein [Thermoanaerobaculia bacterium]
MSRNAPTIVVIGGGFSGAAVAAHLLRRGSPARVVLVNRFGPIGRGVAYGTRIEAHVLNVPAGGMSALQDDRDHFVRWARTRDDGIRAGSFVSRRLYGEYLESLLRETEQHAPRTSRLERLVGVARDVEIRAGGEAAEVVFAGARIVADHVVLALGNYSPTNPAAVGGEFYETDRYVRDPWVRGALDAVRPGESVLMLGTGLTMMDIALDLAARGVRLPLFAVSRHGLVPRAHRADLAPAGPEALPPGFDGPPRSIARYARLVRRHVAARAEAGGDWRDVVGALRPITPALWMGLTQEERARFLRHLRPWWDVHRHRAAPETARAVETMLAAGDLSVRAARILGYRSVAGEVEVTIRPRGASEAGRVHVNRVVNCTGPSTDVRRVGDPLLDALLARRLLRPDPLGLGLETAADGALFDAAGRPSRVLSLVGPLLKADRWEATAVPELRERAARLAERLLP